jgi:serine/threonine protein phosphatase PrpC
VIPISKEFEVAAGSIIGQYHLRINFNNQDNYIITEHPDHIVAVVCDGCGSGVTSEVGATLGSSMVSWELSASGLHRLGDNKEEVELCLERVRRLIVDRITAVAFKAGLPFVTVISDCFLFTIVAAVVGKEHTYIISFGDGFYALNGKVSEIGPFENNAPPYVAYGAIEEHLKEKEDLHFVLHEIIPTSELESLLVATDGLSDLIEAEEKKLPGKNELVGPASQFWTRDLFFSNQAAVSRRLALINRSVTKIDRKNVRLTQEHGYLKDDTTLIAIRRVTQNDRLPGQEKAESQSC